MFQVELHSSTGLQLDPSQKWSCLQKDPNATHCDRCCHLEDKVTLEWFLIITRMGYKS